MSPFAFRLERIVKPIDLPFFHRRKYLRFFAVALYPPRRTRRVLPPFIIQPQAPPFCTCIKGCVMGADCISQPQPGDISLYKVRRMYTPHKYFGTLSKSKTRKRVKEIQHFGKLDWKNPKAYIGFQTDKGVKTRKSSYTATWNRKYPDIKSLKDRATLTGFPLNLLQKSYDRGMAAWRTGHRPGATQQQWGYARVSSLLLGGKTAHTTDSDLVRSAITRSRKAKQWYKSIHYRVPSSPHLSA